MLEQIKEKKREQVILNTNLRFVITSLDMKQRGELLSALLGLMGEPLSDEVDNVFQYINVLQEEIFSKKKRMREIGAKGNEARRLKAKLQQNAMEPELFEEKTFCDEKSIPYPEHKEQFDKANPSRSKNLCLADALDIKRKEAKENNNIINKNNFILKTTEKEKRVFDKPRVEEVKAFVDKEGLKVDAEAFVNFYEARDWLVGKTEIKNWQPLVRSWHIRASNFSPHEDDEAYWSQLKQNVVAKQKDEEGKKVLPLNGELKSEPKEKPSSLVFKKFISDIAINQQRENEDERK